MTGRRPDRAPRRDGSRAGAIGRAGSGAPAGCFPVVAVAARASSRLPGPSPEAARRPAGRLGDGRGCFPAPIGACLLAPLFGPVAVGAVRRGGFRDRFASRSARLGQPPARTGGRPLVPSVGSAPVAVGQRRRERRLLLGQPDGEGNQPLGLGGASSPGGVRYGRQRAYPEADGGCEVGAGADARGRGPLVGGPVAGVVACRTGGLDVRRRAEEANRRLASVYGGDPAVVDVTRVMRVPGFVNRKPGRGRTLGSRWFRARATTRAASARSGGSRRRSGR